MAKTSWVELCVSDFEQSITWFERVLAFLSGRCQQQHLGEIVISL